jgi:adhesin/invasin
MLKKVKRFLVTVTSLLIIVSLGSLSGCGDSVDPLGVGIIQFYDATTGVVVTSMTVDPGSSLTLVVKVKILRSDGTLAPVIGERVTFTLLTPVNGGGVTVMNDRTAGDGQAMAVYTSGNNFGIDSVRATTGSGATATITITKTGGLIGARIATMTASPATVGSGGSSVITATVTDGNSNPMQGETVTFTLPVNGSGANFATPVSVATDAGGNAVVIYRAGGNTSLIDIFDTVRGALANGSSNAVVITVSGPAPPTPGTPLSIAVAAVPASVAAGLASVVTATLTGDNNAGVTVTFSLPLNNSGATLSASSAVTDGSGVAVVTYTAGTDNPTLTVSDTVRAAVSSISSSAAITRTGSAVTLGYTVTVTAAPAVLTADTANSIITANVKNNGVAVIGQLVTFTITGTAPLGAFPGVAPWQATTDASGNAVNTFTGGGAHPTGETNVVTATITVGATNYTGNVIITYP